jgi:hypothetical protein
MFSIRVYELHWLVEVLEADCNVSWFNTQSWQGKDGGTRIM